MLVTLFKSKIASNQVTVNSGLSMWPYLIKIMQIYIRKGVDRALWTRYGACLQNNLVNESGLAIRARIFTRLF